MPKATNQPQLQQLAREHEELAVMISDLRSWLAEVAELGIPHFGELGTRLQPLCDKLREHFAHEEANGYLADVIAADPRLTSNVNQLLAQHAVFRNRLETLIRRLRDSETPFDSWQTACEEFESLCADIARHEQNETAMQITASQANTVATDSGPQART